MTPEQITLVQASFQKVVPIAGTAADLFYDRLFETAPQTRALFPQDMAEQKKKLMAMLGTAVANLHKLDTILPAVQALGQRHKGYGVTADQLRAGRRRAALDAGERPRPRLHARDKAGLDRSLTRASRRGCMTSAHDAPAAWSMARPRGEAEPLPWRSVATLILRRIGAGFGAFCSRVGLCRADGCSAEQALRSGWSDVPTTSFTTRSRDTGRRDGRACR